MIDDILPNYDFDMLLTSPPYFSIEKYSDDKNDLSNMKLEEFKKIYCNIINKCSELLIDGSFVAWNIQNPREPNDGGIMDLTGITKNTFNNQGFILINELIIAKAIEL